MHCMLWTILHVLYWKGFSGLYWYMPCVPRALDVCTVSSLTLFFHLQSILLACTLHANIFELCIMVIYRWVLFTYCPDDFDYMSVLRNKHERLFERGLNETHFDRFMNCLLDTMRSVGIQRDLVDEATRILGPIRHVFVEAVSYTHLTLPTNREV